MNAFSLVSIGKADRIDEHLAAAAYDIIGQINCTLYLHVKTLFTKHRYHSLQTLELNRVKKLLSQKLYIDYSKDAKALYIDRHYVESLVDFARENHLGYTAGYAFLTQLTSSIYEHLFTPEERDWIANQELEHNSKKMRD